MRLAWWAVVLGALSLTEGCHRRRRGGGRRVEHDPRKRYATGCVDPRYVYAPPTPVPNGGGTAPRSPVTVHAGTQYIHAWAAAEGVFAWREGTAEPYHIATQSPEGGVAGAAAGDRAVFAWKDGSSALLSVVTLDAEGAAAWAPTLGSGRNPALAASRTVIALAVEEGDGDEARVVLRLHSREGRALANPVSVAPREVAHDPAVAWTGARFVVAWRTGTDAAGAIRMATVSPEGERMTEPVDVARPRTPVGAPSIAWGGGRVGVTWADRAEGDPALHSTALDLTGRRLGEPQRLSARYRMDSRASLVWDGAAFGVVWWEPVGGGLPRAYGALVGRDGRRIDTEMRWWVEGEVALREPSVVWDAPNYVMLALRGADGIELRRTGPRLCDMPL